jgi:3'(2'), 5'-bisphosphate nucleotidase
MIDKIDLVDIVEIARLAGSEILRLYDGGNFDIETKDDSSPVTTADINANDIICKALCSKYANIPILSEENEHADYQERSKWELFWLIDPLDGTKEFITKSGEFTVNIALIENSKQVLGVVYAPSKNMMFYAKVGQGAFYNGKKIKPLNNRKSMLFATSKNHIDRETLKYIELYKTDKNKEQLKMGSSLKFCLLAMGDIDVYPRFTPTMEWDTAAAHAILLLCNKNIYMLDKKTAITYNKESLKNPSFVAK